MTIKEAYQQLLFQLYALYDNREAANIADMVMEYITGQRKIERVMHPSFPINADQQNLIADFTQQLLSNIPVQYVLQEAWFCGMKFFVDENVLIPRPETEELIEWIMEESQRTKLPIKNLLDIGTGSGCIAISLKKKMNTTSIHSTDISKGAINVAKKNAASFNTEINFIELDFLNELHWPMLPHFDIIVSNPPYIRASEKKTMSKQVVDQEPHLALFVPDNDALIFYKKIALFGKHNLNPNGKIFVEINEAMGKATVNIFKEYGYQTHLKKDMQGKDRMIMTYFIT
jgi:release factor glutamine methyltransferase